MPREPFPNFFIIGAPKCGTTSIYEYLRGHPQIFMSAVKEPHYFAPDLFREESHGLRHGVDRQKYLDLFRGAKDAKIIGEGSTRYLYSVDAPRLIKAESPDAHLVVALRNPVDMIQSFHAHRLAGGQEDLADLREALDAEADRKEGRRLPPKSTPKLAMYRDRARFSEQLPRWFDTFGRDAVHVVIFEDFVSNPATEYERLLRFLGVDPAYRPAEFATHNPSHTMAAPVKQIASNSAMQTVVWGPVVRLFGDARTRATVRRIRHSRLVRRPTRRVKMDPQLRAQLEAEFRPDVEATSELLGRDLVSLWFGDQAANAFGNGAVDNVDSAATGA